MKEKVHLKVNGFLRHYCTFIFHVS